MAINIARRKLIAALSGAAVAEEMNAATRRGNPRHYCTGGRFAYAKLWNR
jgi:hypothetical protein